MAVGFVAASTVGTATGGAGSASCVLTVAGGHTDNCLFVVLAYDQVSSTISTVVWDPTGANQSFTRIDTRKEYGTSLKWQELWQLINPTAGAGKTITATTANESGWPANWVIIAAHFDGVDQTTPVRAGSYNSDITTNSSPVDVVITSQTGDMTLTGIHAGMGAGTLTTSQTSIGISTVLASTLAGGMDYAAGAASNTHTWSMSSGSGSNALAGFSIAASAGAAAPTPNTFDTATVAEVITPNLVNMPKAFN